METPPYREWEHNASMSSINSKNLRHERLLSGCMGSTECRSFCYLFLLKTESSEKWSFSVLDLHFFYFEKKAVVVSLLNFRNLPSILKYAVCEKYFFFHFLFFLSFSFFVLLLLHFTLAVYFTSLHFIGYCWSFSVSGFGFDLI